MAGKEKVEVQGHKPTIFGKYCLLERVNVGGMAEVFRARPFNAPHFKRFLAVKRILPNLAEDKEFIDMFIDEAKIAVQLNHHNVCQIYELGKLNEAYYIVMEFIAGKDLLGMQNYFRRRRRIMSVTQAAYIISKVCEGLHYAHRKKDSNGRKMNIIHRDISPQNILVAYDGEVKVIDFGIARAATKNNKTQVGVLKGKFGYMSPEQVSGKEIDHRSDVFAVGALFWELLTARRLFHGKTDFETLEKVRAADVIPPSEKNRKVPPEIDRIVLKALARDREERYQSTSEIAHDLQKFLDKVRPAYKKKTLSTWMVAAFADKLREERTKVHDFKQFITADDVRAYNNRKWEMDEGIFELDLEDMEDEDATQIFEADKEFVEDMAAEKSVVLAANELEPLQTAANALNLGYDLPVTGRSTERYLDTNLSGIGTDIGAAKLNKLNFLLLFIFFILLSAGMFFYFDQDSPAELYLNVTPAVGVQVQINGEPQMGELPMHLFDLEAGEVYVDLRHPDYEPLLEPVELIAGEATRLDLALVPLTNGVGTLILSLGEHADATIYLNGEMQDSRGTERRVDVSAAEEYILEAYLPGHFVEEYSIQLRRNEQWEREINFRPVLGSVSLSSTPTGIVFVNEEERGVTSSLLNINGLNPLQVHELEIRPRTQGSRTQSHRNYRQNIVFDGAYRLRIAPRLPRITEEDEDASIEFGFLTADADGEWYRIMIDGRDSGFVTPLMETPLPISAGEHTIGFSRGRENVEILITVENEAVVHAEKP